MSPGGGGPFWKQGSSKQVEVQNSLQRQVGMKLLGWGVMLPWISTRGVLLCYYNDVIMSAIASQITSLSIAYLTIYSGAVQRKHQSSASLALCGEFTGNRWIPRTKGQWRGNYYHLVTSSLGAGRVWLWGTRVMLLWCTRQAWLWGTGGIYLSGVGLWVIFLLCSLTPTLVMDTVPSLKGVHLRLYKEKTTTGMVITTAMTVSPTKEKELPTVS